MTEPLFEVRGLTKRFRGLTAVSNVTFRVAAREIVGLIGPNGAGKTTIISLISGTLVPTAGDIVFEGRHIERLPAYRRARLGIGRTFQVMKPFPGLSVLENVTVGALFGTGGGERNRTRAEERAREWLKFTGLERRMDQRADALGGPDRKRLEFAKALAMNPKLLLLDEVMAGLTHVEVEDPRQGSHHPRHRARDEGHPPARGPAARAPPRAADRRRAHRRGAARPARGRGVPRQEAAVTPALLEIASLSAGYGEVPVLSGVAMVIRPGEIVTMVGSNGAGKTTLLRAISRVIGARGTLRFDGRDLTALTPEQVFGLGLVQVPEGRQLFDRMTVEDNLRMGTYRRRDDARIQQSFERVYQLFPVLAERRQQIAGSLSGGEQQMCAIARGLMAAPKLLTVDEMSLGLAPVVVDQLLGVLGEIRKQGITVLLDEQDVFAAFSVADRGYVMETGRIVREGAVAELEKDPEVRKAYLGVQ